MGRRITLTLPGFGLASGAVGCRDRSFSTSVSTAAAALFDPAREFRMMQTAKNMCEVMANSLECSRDAVSIANATGQVR